MVRRIGEVRLQKESCDIDVVNSQLLETFDTVSATNMTFVCHHDDQVERVRFFKEAFMHPYFKNSLIETFLSSESANCCCNTSSDIVISLDDVEGQTVKDFLTLIITGRVISDAEGKKKVESLCAMLMVQVSLRCDGPRNTRQSQDLVRENPIKKPPSSSSKKFKCKVCTKEFDLKVQLNHHMSRKHKSAGQVSEEDRSDRSGPEGSIRFPSPKPGPASKRNRHNSGSVPNSKRHDSSTDKFETRSVIGSSDADSRIKKKRQKTSEENKKLHVCPKCCESFAAEKLSGHMEQCHKKLDLDALPNYDTELDE